MAAAKTVLLLIPSYNDWEAAAALLEQVEELKLPGDLKLKALLIDDGSILPMPGGLAKRKPGSALSSLAVMQLARNLGHQGAISVGLSQLAASGDRFDAVVVMDGDGEDAPSDILRLAEAWKESGHQSAVFAQRTRRSEGLLFRVFYALYRASYRLLTGTWISMGNFSLIPRSYVSKLVLYPELFRHYPATVKKSKLPVILIPTARAPRIRGRSKMNFYHLVLHGLGAITVHSDIVGVRSLAAVIALLSGCVLGVAGLLWAWLAGRSVPAWSPTLLVILSMVALQFLSSAIIFSFLTLSGRSPLALNPAQSFQGFIKRSRRLY
jgi:hypothetical protein